jgi:hypothetical protein
MNGFKPPTWSTKRRVRGAHLPFCILTVVGDVLDDGELHFVETAESFEAARQRIDALARVWPRQYVIYNRETGERVFITPKPA